MGTLISGEGPPGSLVAKLAAWGDGLPHGEKVVARLWLARASAGQAASPAEVDVALAAVPGRTTAELVQTVVGPAVADRYAFFPGDVWEEAQGAAGSRRPAPITAADVEAFAARLGGVASAMRSADRAEVHHLTVRGAALIDRIRWRVQAGTATPTEAAALRAVPSRPRSDQRG